MKAPQAWSPRNSQVEDLDRYLNHMGGDPGSTFTGC